jgi:predicted anti-sigma-YlaC factor YlaD
MMSCKKATHLMSQQLDRKLSTGETMSLKFHLMMCTGCTNFKKNMAFLREACERITSDVRTNAKKEL